MRGKREGKGVREREKGDRGEEQLSELIIHFL